jgi:hypothetical protein
VTPTRAKATLADRTSALVASRAARVMEGPSIEKLAISSSSIAVRIAS